MIRKLLRKVFRRAADAPAAEPALIPVARHGIRRGQVSPAARKVCKVLQESGHKAYVVGGAVRDLLIGHPPKDYDVATSATPEEVRALFRRSRIIGRRFKIVHVMSGPETIEVSTFRASQDADSAETDEHGRVLRDNVFGTMAEDATRRDFTVNALYYDPETETIVDYHHGVADVQQKTLRMIGDPRTRYREDPVRMLRAVRLGAKLGLVIDPAARKPIREMALLLENVPAARLFDEMLKLLFSGYAVGCLKQLREEGLHHGLLPLLDVILEQPLGERFVWLSLENTDERVRADKPVSPGFLFATLLWHEVLANWEARKAEGEHTQPALFSAMDEVLDAQAGKLAITRRIVGDIKDIWALQPRFDRRSGKTPYRLIEQPRFRAGWDFLRLRALSGEIPMELPDWWDRFAHAGPDEREALLNAAPAGSEAPAKKRRRRRRKPAGAGAAETADAS
ncbi:polynucleotide adenylyltransferase PcnB [Pseudothauera rhizosphaerae]|uniref:Poly(A) polymerase I n=1 Tax=Pseudothauera rhizosphaerae TaxID=2565932 RepID=A0A4S4A972_9RHOO|nr:polynucleotide adenylyltransferase PcnB [Pseudothauera rhizosphaerae]THF55377.1 polynucleotide adenylyltransferase PcnB [Pseudothauera rhizosphaerae]